MTDSVGGTVLMMDDEPALIELYPRLLPDSHDVITAINGKVGIAAFGGTDDVAIPDRRMPGLSGDAVLEALRSNDRSRLLVMLAAVDPNFDINDMPFDCHLPNSVSREELTRAIRELLSLESYRKTILEYYRVVRNRGAVRGVKSAPDLEMSDTFENLEDEIDGFERRVADQIDPTDDGTFIASLRGVETGGLEDG